MNGGTTPRRCGANLADDSPRLARTDCVWRLYCPIRLAQGLHFPPTSVANGCGVRLATARRNPNHVNLNFYLRLHLHRQDHRHRPRHDELVRVDHGGRSAQGSHQRAGQPHHPVGCCVYRKGRAPGRPARQAPAGHQPEEHDLFDQALHGSAHGRSGQGTEDGSIRGARIGRRVGQGQHPLQALHAT